MLRWILISQNLVARKRRKEGTVNRLHFKQRRRKEKSVVLFRPGSSEAVVLKRTAKTVKQPPTVRPSGKSPTVKSSTLFKKIRKTTTKKRNK